MLDTDFRTSLLNDLRSDLAEEFRHLTFYVLAAASVQGPRRAELSKKFREESVDELDHARRFAEIIEFLGGTSPEDPTVMRDDARQPSQTAVRITQEQRRSGESLLRAAIEMEKTVVENYVKRLDQLECLSKATQIVVRNLLEDVMADSLRTVWEFERAIG